MSELAIKEPDSLVIRPHHLEGALHGLIAAVYGPQAAGIEESMEPEKAIVMVFDAEDYVLSTTPDDVRQQIEARYSGDSNFAKVVAFLRGRMAANPDAASLIPHGDGYRALKKAYDADPLGATVIFRNVYDTFCRQCPYYKPDRPCMAKFIKSPDGRLDMDDAVIEAHPWEYDRPYKVGEVLRWLIAESTRRRITMLFAGQYADSEKRRAWEADITAPKRVSLPVIK